MPDTLDGVSYFHKYVCVFSGERAITLAKKVLLKPSKTPQLIDDVRVDSALVFRFNAAASMN